MKTIVYVDGFNLYYGALRKTPYLWLDLEKLVSFILKLDIDSIVRIRYFTAPVSARPTDLKLPMRQQLYLRALRTNPKTDIHQGQFLSHPVKMAECDETGKMTGKYTHVLKTEEKGSDVNLATYLLMDAFEGAFEQAVIISNDSDFLTPIKFVRQKYKKKVGLLNPQKSKASHLLKQNVDFVRDIREGVLKASQFNDTLTDRHGTFTKPNNWVI